VPRIIRGWQAVYGRSNILAVPVAGCLTPRRGSSIHTSIQAVSSVRFARPRSTRGQAIMIFSIGRSIRCSRPPLGKGGSDGISDPRTCAASRCQPCLAAQEGPKNCRRAAPRNARDARSLTGANTGSFATHTHRIAPNQDNSELSPIRERGLTWE
jgi:hypothetical protein